LNFYYFLSQRLLNTKEKSFSGLVSNIAIISIAVSLAIMIVSYSILHGFRHEIESKIYSFSGHIQVSKYDVKNSFEENPISIHRQLYTNATKISNVTHIQKYSHKAALLKSSEGVSGIVLKGIGQDFDTSRFNKNMLSGTLPILSDSNYSKQITISQKISDKMMLSVGDSVIIYFVQNPPRYRKLIVKGIYETSMEEFDEAMVFCDIRLNQKINNWNDSLVGGYEIFVKNKNKMDTTITRILEEMDYDMQLEKVSEKFLALFEWLNLLDRNVVIFLGLILIVAGFNIISTLFIMIMEHTQMIGILKSLGATNNQIQKLFFTLGLQILFKGLLWGNILGLTICWVQDYFKLITLDPNTYYMEYAPISWHWDIIIILNLLIVAAIAMVLIFPTIIISKISPVKSIKWN
jgi:lipoprotein-releasing system permease protein